MKKIIPITQSEFKSIIKKTCERLLKETKDNGSASQPYLVDITNTMEMQQYREEIYNILCRTYESIGGMKGFPNSKSLLRAATILTLYTNGIHIYSVAIYSNRLKGQKMILIGNDGSEIGSEGVEKIIQHNIENYKGWYWCEASKGIEQLFKKNNGYPIPAQFASTLLYKANGIEILDDFHYRRPIGQEGEVFEKVIFGFNSESTLKKVYSEVDNYDELRTAFNQTCKTNESIIAKNEQDWEMACAASHVINTVYENSIVRGMFELTPTQKHYIEYSISLLRPFINEPKVSQNIELGEYMLNNYPLLEAHPF